MSAHIEFTAVVTKGLFGSVAIIELNEKWIKCGSGSDWIETDIEEYGLCDWCDLLDGFDEHEGTVKISGKAICCDDGIDAYIEFGFEQIKPQLPQLD